MSEIPQRGSILSLISNRQVRYEGTLDYIEMAGDQSKLCLVNVRSFGTEDRESSFGYTPPSNQTFNSIIFRGSDIINLEVKEYYDPARHAQPQGYSQDPGQQTPQQQSVWGPPNPSTDQRSGWGQGNDYDGVLRPNLQPFHNSTAPPGHATQPAAAPAPQVVVTPSAPRQPLPRSAPQPAASRPVDSADKSATPFQAVQQPQGQAALQGAPPGFASGPPPGMQAPPQTSSTQPGGGRGERGGRGRGRGRRGRGPGRDFQGRGPRAPPVPVPNEDFNFQEGLSKFDKVNEEGAEADMGHANSGSAMAYNKDDFFDELSSDLRDKLNTQEKPQRVPFSEQRKVDMETFGGSGVARRPGRGRGRGRRGGGRGRGRAPAAQAVQVGG